MRSGALVLSGLVAALSLPPAAGGEDAGAESAPALLDRIERAWKARDASAYLATWSFITPEAREAEHDFAREHFGSEETQIVIDRPDSLASGAARVKVGVQIFSLTEPRGRAEEWSFVLERLPSRWAVVSRELRGLVDGLLHLSLHPQGYRADGLTFRLPDFELRMARGALFSSPQEIGPTVLVFVGEGTVRVSPGPATEREQLRQFCGQPEMVEKVRAAFLRIHPADLHRVLVPAELVPDPEAPRRLKAARKFYQEHVGRSFVLEAALPRAPWSLLPGLGDASMTFQAGRRGTLTFTVSRAEAEDISLFDRAKRRQICLYPSEGREARYNEDDRRTVDVLDHDLRVRFEPRRFALEAEDTLRLRLLAPASTISLRLDEALHVHSVTSREGRHLFFRVRGQDSVMVSLGALGGEEGEITLTVRYSGVLQPAPVEQEVLQSLQEPSGRAGRPGPMEEEILIEEVLVYTNRRAWYPRAGVDDYARAGLRFDVPAGFTVVTGGTRTLARSEGGRTTIEYRQDRPGKYITAAVGRLMEAGTRREGPITLHGFGVARTREEAGRMLARAGEILRFFSEEFGPCPYPLLSLVLIEGMAPGGHSPPGMVLIAQRPVLLRGALRDDPANFSDVPGFFLAHEIAHQWWGHGVAGQNYHERWLSEGVAQYAAALWVRHSQGEEAFRGVLRRMANWALRQNDQGPISLGHRLGHIKGDAQIYRAVVYNKGAYVLHMLREIVGEETFRQTLTAFQAEHRYRKAGTEDLREALEAASGRELAAYFREWVYGTALPTLRLSHRTEAAGAAFRTVVRVETRSLPGPVPLELTVTHDGGRELKRVTLEPGGGSFVFETPRRPRKVRVNGDRGLLATLKGR